MLLTCAPIYELTSKNNAFILKNHIFLQNVISIYFQQSPESGRERISSAERAKKFAGKNIFREISIHDIREAAKKF